MNSSPTTAAVCTNCDAPRHGNFCTACGQRFRDHRLQLRQLGKQLAELLFDLESGLLLTLREMLIDPGGLIGRYVEGKRRRYLNPFTYLAICSAIGLAAYKLVDWWSGDFHEKFIALSSADFPPQAAQFLADLISGIIDSSALMSVFLAVPFALFLRVFFGRRFTIAENLVFSLYTLGQSALVGSLSYLPLLFFSAENYGMVLSSTLTTGLSIVVCVQAGRKFFGRSIGPALKVIAALLLSYGLVMLLTMVVVSLTLLMNPQMNEGRTERSLHAAVSDDKIELIEELLDASTEVDQRQSETALHLAAALGHEQIAELLIARGAELEATDHLGRTPLLRAVEQNRRNTVVKLIELGANVGYRLPDGTTALMTASGSRVIRSLIAGDAEVDARRDHRLATALMVAAEGGGRNRVEALLEAGADPNLTNAAGETALDLASNSGVRGQLTEATAKAPKPSP